MSTSAVFRSVRGIHEGEEGGPGRTRPREKVGAK